MITNKNRPVIIIHSLTPRAVLKSSERKYITENLEKPLDITMITYNSDLSLHGVNIPFGLTSITLNADEAEADIENIKIN